MADYILSNNTIVSRKAHFFNLDLYLSQQRTITILKFSLALIFFWFGLLKIINHSPVIELLQNSYPIFAKQPYLGVLGFGEVIIAVGLIINKLYRFSAVLMIFHLVGTLSIAFISPGIIFRPFPILTMEGEFILKNIVLISSGLVLVNSQKV